MANFGAFCLDLWLSTNPFFPNIIYSGAVENAAAVIKGVYTVYYIEKYQASLVNLHINQYDFLVKLSSRQHKSPFK